MKNLITICTIIFCVGCGKICHKDYLVGEILMIPIDLSQFNASEVRSIKVWNVNNGDTTKGNLITNHLFQNQVREENWLTDNPTNGHYSSDLDGSDLYFYFYLTDTSYQLLDSLTDITIKKSKGEVDDKCYEDHTNVQIDVVSFVHNNETKGKDELFVLGR